MTRTRAFRFAAAAAAIVLLIAIALVAVRVVRRHLARRFDAAAYTHAQRLVDIGSGRRLNLYCTGSGSPTVLLDAGLGGTTLSWRFVQPELARGTTVCSYDRAGMGFSDPGPLPRTSAAVVDDLHALVRLAGLARPLVLVGHSLGAMNVRLYAYRYPRDVAGLVLVDGSDEDERNTDRAISTAYWNTQVAEPLRVMQACARTLTPSCLGRRSFFPRALNAERVREARDPSTWTTEISELESYDGRSEDELRAARHSLGAMPMVVLTHQAPEHETGLSETQAARIDAAFLAIHGREARDSTRGISRLVPHSGHDIQLDRPRAVIDAVRAVMRGD